jgi:hypothetical protein
MVIVEVYQRKIESDRIQDRDGINRTPLPVFVRQYFIQKYGLRKLADDYCWGT